jgi:hypothetical protein
MMILASEDRENLAAEAPETSESATTNAAQSAATCVGERITRTLRKCDRRQHDAPAEDLDEG